MLDQAVVDDVMQHAIRENPRECCGLVIVFKGRQRYIPCENVSGDPRNRFIISERDYAAAEDVGEVIAVAHSHTLLPATPTQPDLVSIEATKLPWLIVNPNNETHTITNPSGYIAPLVGREFSHGLLDCYALLRDYYRREVGVSLPDYAREEAWWVKGFDLISENYGGAGFVEISEKDLEKHDVLLMRLGGDPEKSIINHVAIYVGQNMILHHVSGRLSSRDIYGDSWRQYTRRFLRYRGTNRNEDDPTIRGAG